MVKNMQTFLPLPDFVDTAKVLDWRRLGKQRVEAMQIIKAIEIGKGWVNHPATKMWTPYVDALKLYHNIIIQEWIERGYKNNMTLYCISSEPEMPWWLGIDDFHKTHQSMLVQKLPEHYEKFFPNVDKNLEYLWQSRDSFIKKYAKARLNGIEKS